MVRQPNSAQAYLEKASGEYAVLYQQEHPPPTGRSVPTHISPFQIDNRFLPEEEVVTEVEADVEAEVEAEVEAAVRQLRVNRSRVHMQLQVEHFKTWLREAYPEKKTTARPKPSKWMNLVELVQFMRDKRTISGELV